MQSRACDSKKKGIEGESETRTEEAKKNIKIEKAVKRGIQLCAEVDKLIEIRTFRDSLHAGRQQAAKPPTTGR